MPRLAHASHCASEFGALAFAERSACGSATSRSPAVAVKRTLLIRRACHRPAWRRSLVSHEVERHFTELLEMVVTSGNGRACAIAAVERAADAPVSSVAFQAPGRVKGRPIVEVAPVAS